MAHKSGWSVFTDVLCTIARQFKVADEPNIEQSKDNTPCDNIKTESTMEDTTEHKTPQVTPAPQEKELYQNYLGKDYVNPADEVYLLWVIGRGSKAETRIGWDRRQHSFCAVKILPKNILIKFKYTPEKARKELKVLETLPVHDNICAFRRAFESEDSVYFLQRLGGVSTFSMLIKKNGGLGEEGARQIIKQLLSAVSCLHSANIYHQDLTSGNILMTRNNRSIQVIDYGNAKLNNDRNRDIPNTRKYYRSIEKIMKSECTPESVDVWSIGVNAYYGTYGQFPFDPEIVESLDGCSDLHKVLDNLTLVFPPFPEVSADFKDLLSRIFVPAQDRISIDDMNRHRWITR